MKELSLNVLDIVENSVKAKATLTQILLSETEETLSLTIIDDGCGMDEQVLKSVTDPFYTTRTTRKVGMGIPLLKMEAEMTGGSFDITSSVDESDHGTTVNAVFYKNHIDFIPLGDIISSVVTLIQGHPDTDFVFVHEKGEKSVSLDTREIRSVLGDAPINDYSVLQWIRESLTEEYNLL